MKVMTLQVEVEHDNMAYAISEEFPQFARISRIELPAETNISGGWTSVGFKLLYGSRPTQDDCLFADHITEQLVGAEKVFLEPQQMQLSAPFTVVKPHTWLAIEFRNGTPARRMYTAQVLYE